MSNLVEIDDSSLSDMRMEIIEALNIFLAHVKNTVTLMVSLVAGGVTIAVYILNNPLPDLPQEILWSFNGAVFFLLVVLSYLSEKICRRYYLIYCSNYIYYARVHPLRSNIDHPWVRDLELEQNMTPEMLEDENAANIFLDGTDSDGTSLKSSDPNSWHYYKLIMKVLGLAGILGFSFCVWRVVIAT